MDSMIGSSASLSILYQHLLDGKVEPGTPAVFAPDHIMGHDVTAPPAADMISRNGIPYLRAAGKTVMYLDHFTPPKDSMSAENCRVLKEFSGRYGIRELVDWGEGICHVHMFEGDLVNKGDLVIGADSHITTGGAKGAFCTAIGSTDLAVAMASGEFWLDVPNPFGIIFDGLPDVWCEGKDIGLRMVSWLGSGGGQKRGLEIDGEILQWLGEDGRKTICNLASEVSCTSSIMTNDMPGQGPSSPRWEWDTEHITIDDMGPQIAVPGSPDRVENIENVTGKAVDQVFVGSCTNGRLDDMRILSEVLKGRKVHPDVRLLVIPGSKSVYSAAERAGYLRNIIDADGIIAMPTCGPCAGGFLGVLPSGDVAVSTTNRNYRGRMGDPTSKIYLAGVAVAGASAVTGVITHPEEVRA